MNSTLSVPSITSAVFSFVALACAGCSVYDPEAVIPGLSDGGSATGAMTGNVDAGPGNGNGDGADNGGMDDGGADGPTGGGDTVGGNPDDTATDGVADATGQEDGSMDTDGGSSWVSCQDVVGVCVEWDLGLSMDPTAAAAAAQTICSGFLDMAVLANNRCSADGAIGRCDDADAPLVALDVRPNLVHFSCDPLRQLGDPAELCEVVMGSWSPIGDGCDVSPGDCETPCEDENDCIDGLTCVDFLNGFRVCAPPQCTACVAEVGNCQYDTAGCGFLKCGR